MNVAEDRFAENEVFAMLTPLKTAGLSLDSPWCRITRCSKVYELSGCSSVMTATIVDVGPLRSVPHRPGPYFSRRCLSSKSGPRHTFLSLSVFPLADSVQKVYFTRFRFWFARATGVLAHMNQRTRVLSVPEFNPPITLSRQVIPRPAVSCPAGCNKKSTRS